MFKNINTVILGNNKTKLQFSLVHTATYVCMHRADVVTIGFNINLNDWSLHLFFNENPSGIDRGVDLKISDKTQITIAHNNWIADDWIEYREPLRIASKDEKTVIFVKLRSLATSSQDNRTIQLSIWKQVPSHMI